MRCWEMANEIMDQLENGQIKPIRRKKNVSKYNVVQTSFQCLSGKDVIKNEDEIFEILKKYNNGTLPEEGGTKPKKARKSEDPSTSVSKKRRNPTSTATVTSTL